MENTQTTNDQVPAPEAAPTPEAVPVTPVAQAATPAPTTAAATEVSGGSSAFPVISMILGILSLIFSFFWATGLVGGVVAVVLGIMGLKAKGRGMAIAGLVLGILGVLGYLGFYMMRKAAGI